RLTGSEPRIEATRENPRIRLAYPPVRLGAGRDAARPLRSAHGPLPGVRALWDESVGANSCPILPTQSTSSSTQNYRSATTRCHVRHHQFWGEVCGWRTPGMSRPSAVRAAEDARYPPAAERGPRAAGEGLAPPAPTSAGFARLPRRAPPPS